jgi:triosephosphate isomerase
MSRTPLIAGNWKMNLNHLEAIQVVQKFAFALPKDYYEHVDVAVIPPFTDIRSVQTVVDGEKIPLTYGAQDVSVHESGAYTGEVSAAMLAKLGCSWAVVGHSERRQYHGEDDATVAAKAKAALGSGLAPIVCVGEPLEVRESGEHVSYVVDQTRASVEGLSAATSVPSSSPMSRCGPSAPARSPPPPTPRRSALRSAGSSPSWPTRRPPTVCASSTADR